MKTTVLSSLFLGLSLSAFCQITNLPALGPVANTNAIPIQNNVNPHQYESNMNAPYGVQGLTAPQSNLGGNHRCKTYELNQQHYLDRGIQMNLIWGINNMLIRSRLMVYRKRLV